MNEFKQNNGKSDFTKGAFWVFFSVVLVITPVFCPYLYNLLQGKSYKISNDALDISLVSFSVSCSLLYLCIESSHISKLVRKCNKVVSFICAVFSIVFYIHVKSKNILPNNIDRFINIGLLVIVYTCIFGYLISNSENKKQESGENNA